MSLSATLDIDASPDTVIFHFHVRQDGTDPRDLQIRSAKFADVAVLDDDDEVWRWSDGQMFAQMLQTLTLEPGQTETYEFEWSNPEPGTYEAVATLNAMEEVSVREQFTV